MSFLKHIGKVAASYQFDILVHEVSNLEKPTAAAATAAAGGGAAGGAAGVDAKQAAAAETFYCTIERSKKRFKTQDKPRALSGSGSSVSWNEVLTFTSTLYKSTQKKLFSKKPFDFRIKSNEMVKGGKFGTSQRKVSLFCQVNLAAFASTGIAQTTQSFPLQSKYGNKKLAASEQPALRLTIACKWINDMEPDKSGYSSCSSKHSFHDVDSVSNGAAGTAAGIGVGVGVAAAPPGGIATGRPNAISIDSGRRSRGNSAESKSLSSTGSVNSANAAAATAASPSAAGLAAIAAAHAASLSLSPRPRRISDEKLAAGSGSGSTTPTRIRGSSGGAVSPGAPAMQALVEADEKHFDVNGRPTLGIRPNSSSSKSGAAAARPNGSSPPAPTNPLAVTVTPPNPMFGVARSNGADDWEEVRLPAYNNPSKSNGAAASTKSGKPATAPAASSVPSADDSDEENERKEYVFSFTNSDAKFSMRGAGKSPAPTDPFHKQLQQPSNGWIRRPPSATASVAPGAAKPAAATARGTASPSTAFTFGQPNAATAPAATEKPDRTGTAQYRDYDGGAATADANAPAAAGSNPLPPKRGSFGSSLPVQPAAATTAHKRTASAVVSSSSSPSVQVAGAPAPAPAPAAPKPLHAPLPQYAAKLLKSDSAAPAASGSGSASTTVASLERSAPSPPPPAAAAAATAPAAGKSEEELTEEQYREATEAMRSRLRRVPYQVWTIEDVRFWLYDLQIGSSVMCNEYGYHFMNNAIDGKMLISLNDTDLQSLGVNNGFHRRRILMETASIREHGRLLDPHKLKIGTAGAELAAAGGWPLAAWIPGGAAAAKAGAGSTGNSLSRSGNRNPNNEHEPSLSSTNRGSQNSITYSTPGGVGRTTTNDRAAAAARRPGATGATATGAARDPHHNHNSHLHAGSHHAASGHSSSAPASSSAPSAMSALAGAGGSSNLLSSPPHAHVPGSSSEASSEHDQSRRNSVSLSHNSQPSVSAGGGGGGSAIAAAAAAAAASHPATAATARAARTAVTNPQVAASSGSGSGSGSTSSTPAPGATASTVVASPSPTLHASTAPTSVSIPPLGLLALAPVLERKSSSTASMTAPASGAAASPDQRLVGVNQNSADSAAGPFPPSTVLFTQKSATSSTSNSGTSSPALTPRQPADEVPLMPAAGIPLHPPLSLSKPTGPLARSQTNASSAAAASFIGVPIARPAHTPYDYVSANGAAPPAAAAAAAAAAVPSLHDPPSLPPIVHNNFVAPRHKSFGSFQPVSMHAANGGRTVSAAPLLMTAPQLPPTALTSPTYAGLNDSYSRIDEEPTVNAARPVQSGGAAAAAAAARDPLYVDALVYSPDAGTASAPAIQPSQSPASISRPASSATGNSQSVSNSTSSGGGGGRARSTSNSATSTGSDGTDPSAPAGSLTLSFGLQQPHHYPTHNHAQDAFVSGRGRSSSEQRRAPPPQPVDVAFAPASAAASAGTKTPSEDRFPGAVPILPPISASTFAAAAPAATPGGTLPATMAPPGVIRSQSETLAHGAPGANGNVKWSSHPSSGGYNHSQSSRLHDQHSPSLSGSPAAPHSPTSISSTGSTFPFGPGASVLNSVLASSTGSGSGGVGSTLDAYPVRDFNRRDSANSKDNGSTANGNGTAAASTSGSAAAAASAGFISPPSSQRATSNDHPIPARLAPKFIAFSQFSNITEFSESSRTCFIYSAKWTRPVVKPRTGAAAAAAASSPPAPIVQDVVIKVPKQPPGTDEWNELFSFLDLPAHPNVLPFQGVCRDFKGLQFKAMCLVTELQRGSLKNLLCDDVLKPTTLVAVLTIALDMARGVAHLHSHGVVHRDLALRNFLLSNAADEATGRERVLVSDFGLARQIDESAEAYYKMDQQAVLPIRWMAPEVLLTHKSTRMSDVWMYGVAVWEVLTGGKEQPYSEVKTSNQVIVGVCAGTLRLSYRAADHPIAAASPELRALIDSCTAIEETKRPAMADVVTELTAMLERAVSAASPTAAHTAAAPPATAAAPAASPPSS